MAVSEAVARAAALRTESRGAHSREDHEDEDEAWLRWNVVIRKGKDGRMEVEKVERKAPPKYLEEIAYSKIEDLEAGRVGADAPED
jgi:succinate dehydrogenase / fumarate reductase flavoprotein subunit